MDYDVFVTPDAKEDLEGFIYYLLVEKKSRQAAKNVLDDFEATKRSLATVAGSIKLCDNLRLKDLGYRRINFLSHRYFMLFRIEGNQVIIDSIFRYFMLFRIEGNQVIIDSIFHELQDYERKMF